MKADPMFTELMGRLGRGQEEAAVEIFHRYVGRLVALADGLLNDSLRAKVEPEDVVQSALRTFFRRCQEHLVRAGDWDELWALLVVITARKCRNELRHFRAACRDTRREVRASGPDEEWWHALDHEPGPAEAAALTETLERLLSGVDPPERAIGELFLQGHAAPEIGRRLGRAERTVRRVCAFLRGKLERLLAEQPE